MAKVLMDRSPKLKEAIKIGADIQARKADFFLEPVKQDDLFYLLIAVLEALDEQRERIDRIIIDRCRGEY